MGVVRERMHKNCSSAGGREMRVFRVKNHVTCDGVRVWLTQVSYGWSGQGMNAVVGSSAGGHEVPFFHAKNHVTCDRACMWLLNGVSRY